LTLIEIQTDLSIMINSGKIKSTAEAPERSVESAPEAGHVV